MSAPAPTPPSGESAPPSLPTERDREAVRRMAARIVSEGQPWRFAVPGNVELLAAEVARLTALLEDHGPDGRNVTNAQHQAMRERALAAEARAARLEEAHAVLAAFVRTAPGCLPERVQRAVNLAPWDGALYRAFSERTPTMEVENG